MAIVLSIWESTAETDIGELIYQRTPLASADEALPTIEQWMHEITP